MKSTGKDQRVFQVPCPGCGSLLWVDPVLRKVIKSEKQKRKKGSLDDLLIQEKKKKKEFERKFEATSEMQKEKQREAEEKFRKALGKIAAEESE